QAEDGIRDFHVTGVQTCALPICCGSNEGVSCGSSCDAAADGNFVAVAKPAVERLLHAVQHGTSRLLWDVIEQDVPGTRAMLTLRSEERRVGNECRSLWSAPR